MTSVFDEQAEIEALIELLNTRPTRVEERAYKIERTMCTTIPFDVHWASDNPTRFFMGSQYPFGSSMRSL